MVESGEPQVLSLRMRGFDEDELKHEIKEGSVTSDDRDSPDSSSRYIKILDIFKNSCCFPPLKSIHLDFVLTSNTF